MNYLLLGSVALLAAAVLFNFVRKVEAKKLVKSLRWIVGGGALLLAVALSLARSFALASMIGAVGLAILLRGRIGPIDFNTDFGDLGDAGEQGEESTSTVKSRFFSMRLEHATGTMTGSVVSGAFAGTDLADLGEAETRDLLDEVATDADSRALLETWLDANRKGWREWFASHPRPGTEAPHDTEEEAYDVLGLAPGATPEEIRAAHHRLMKGVHPDQGGSTYLAAKINEAKDLLLKKYQKRA